MNLFGDSPTKVFIKFLMKTSECFRFFMNKNKQNLILSARELMNSLKSFLYKNKIDFIDVSGIFIKDIVNNLFNVLIVDLKQVEEFLTKLYSYKEIFIVTTKTSNIKPKLDIYFTHVFNRYVICELCELKDIYTLLYKFNDDYVKQIGEVKNKSPAIDDENRNKINRYQNDPAKIRNNSDRCELNNYNFYPKYLLDYILYI
ncbi:uncharacterized protein LOC126908408 isoform X1 [Daktulosphaira vitifoliae]|uniref:uncharacterized protein LOC126908408 isoform X1 n=1 Tax=Daktulosphaira vitifoliae TaxID=58002 RepID=UPI0021AAEDA6|nr:uncharacterized protein LOC126908408 isoform X1 [Daktulosphaira vitifoliae]